MASINFLPAGTQLDKDSDEIADVRVDRGERDFALINNSILTKTRFNYLVWQNNIVYIVWSCDRTAREIPMPN